MKSLTTIVLIVGIVLCVANDSHAQTGWSSSKYYAQRGGVGLTCGPTYVIRNTDGWNYWNEGWQNCRKRVWYQEYHSGYIYLWGPNGWYREWRQGNYWYFTWYDFKQRVW